MRLSEARQIIEVTKKKQRRRLASEIRKATGIDLPTAQLIAKKYVAGGLDAVEQAQFDGWSDSVASKTLSRLADVVKMNWNKSRLFRDTTSASVTGPRGVYTL